MALPENPRSVNLRIKTAKLKIQELSKKLSKDMTDEDKEAFLRCLSIKEGVVKDSYEDIKDATFLTTSIKEK